MTDRLLRFDLSADDQALFLAEVDELLQRVEESLVDLERAPDDQGLLNEIFRAAHTIKGSSATIGHTRMAALTHAMETRLDDVRKGVAAVTPQLIEALLKALDVLKLLRDEVETHVAAEVDVDAVAAGVERRASLRAATTGRARSTKRLNWPQADMRLHDSRSTKRLTRPEADRDATELRSTKRLKRRDSDRRATEVRSTGQLKTSQGAHAGATHRFSVVLEDGPWAAVRALQVLLVLGEHGKVVASQPTQAEIESEDYKIGSRLTVQVCSDKPEQLLVHALNSVPELGSITAETLSKEPGQPSPVMPETISEVAAPQPLSSASRHSSTTIRIDVARLDALLNLVGELVIDRTRLVQLGGSLVEQFGDARLLGDLQETAMHIGRITDELQEQVMKSRMLPVESVFNRLPRVVRDVASKQGKQIDLTIEGKETELDRSVIEEIGDPLLHLIRNAVDHGIETAEERVAAGKPPAGALRLSARQADSFIVISLEDDGRGVNIDAVKRKAVERAEITQEQSDRLSDLEAVQLIFSPGLSTAQKLSDVSGRGVGMDVVRANVEKINGSVEVETRRGRGTTFTIRLPLTLAIVQALLVRVAGGIYALPIHSVTETFRVEMEQIHRVNHREAILLRDQVLPLVSLRNVFGLSDGENTRSSTTSKLVVAVHASNRQVGLIVDGLVGEQEIVIKPLGQLVGDVAVSGAAILGDGSVALIVDVAVLIAQAIRDNTTVAQLAVA